MIQRARNIVVWQPVLTDHQAFTYQELSRQSALPVIAQVVRLEDDTRRAQGWADTRVTGVERQLIPQGDFLLSGLRCLLSNRDQIHIFGSPFEDIRLILLLWLATRLGITCFIISEPYSTVPVGYLENKKHWKERLKTLLRPRLYRFYILALRGGLDGIFTISRLASQQYAQAGMPADRLFPFGYFVPTELVPANAAATSTKNGLACLKLVFVGALIERKGLATLIAAVRSAIQMGARLQLDIYGPGNPKEFDFDGCCVRYEGTIPFGQAQHYLAAYDLLVLPSQFDGWGVVVNEALCAGVPTLCSDHVGASVLVETFRVGAVFSSGDTRELANKLVALAADHVTLARMKSACLIAAKAIQPAVAASYILQVLATEPAKRASVPSPWYGVEIENS